MTERTKIDELLERERKLRRQFVLELNASLKAAGDEPDIIPGTPYTGHYVMALEEKLSHARPGDRIYIKENGDVLRVPEKYDGSPHAHWAYLADFDYNIELLRALEHGVNQRLEELKSVLTNPTN